MIQVILVNCSPYSIIVISQFKPDLPRYQYPIPPHSQTDLVAVYGASDSINNELIVRTLDPSSETIFQLGSAIQEGDLIEIHPRLTFSLTSHPPEGTR